jgi:adenylate kinase
MGGRFYFVGGVNGVGKSTFLKKLALWDKGAKFTVVSGSRELMKWLGIEPRKYSRLQKLDDKYKRRELGMMIKFIVKNNSQNKKTLIFDGHYLHYKKGALINAVDGWIKFFKAMFLIDAPAKVIVDRIYTDKKRSVSDRDLFPVGTSKKQKEKIIDFYCKTTMDEVRKTSRRYGIPYFVISSDKDPREMLAEFIYFHNKITASTQNALR